MIIYFKDELFIIKCNMRESKFDGFKILFYIIVVNNGDFFYFIEKFLFYKLFMDLIDMF